MLSNTWTTISQFQRRLLWQILLEMKLQEKQLNILILRYYFDIKVEMRVYN